MAANTGLSMMNEVRTTMAIFNKGVGAAVLVLLTYGMAAAQGAPASDAERARAADLIRSRQAISTMEAVLQRAILNGAERVMAQVRTLMPLDRPRLSSNPRVHGVRLENYGVLFDVQVPGLDLPILWDVVVNNQSRETATAMALQQLRANMTGLQGAERARAQELILQLEQQMLAGNLRGGGEARGPSTTSVVPAATQDAKVDPRVVEDPEGSYTREVKTALIEAMLTNSQALGVGADESLIVVARGTPSSPLSPGDSIDSSTWVMRVKGSVLAAFRAGTTSEEEARKQVEIKEQ
jgi:hypothetical protein